MKWGLSFKHNFQFCSRCWVRVNLERFGTINYILQGISYIRTSAFWIISRKWHLTRQVRIWHDVSTIVGMAIASSRDFICLPRRTSGSLGVGRTVGRVNINDVDAMVVLVWKCKGSLGMKICRENAFGLSLGDPEIRELTEWWAWVSSRNSIQQRGISDSVPMLRQSHAGRVKMETTTAATHK